jgi:hypothetical protein
VANYPLTIWTTQSLLDNGYSVGTSCPKCRVFREEVDLEKLVKQGVGERAPSELGLKCRTCATRLLLTVKPPSRHAK